MREVKVMPRFQCGYCKKRSIKRVIEVHEKRCFRNPARFCDYCDNTGKIEVSPDIEMGSYKEDCPYCGRFDPEQLKGIEAREQKHKEENSVVGVAKEELPF